VALDAPPGAGSGESQQPTVLPPRPANNAASVTAGTGATVFNPAIETTGDIVLRRHLISDEQLNMLAGENRDGLSEAFWAFVAGALGSAPSALESLYGSYFQKPPIPLTLVHLLEVIILAICVALGIGVHFVRSRRTQRVEDLVEKIKTRAAQ